MTFNSVISETGGDSMNITVKEKIRIIMDRLNVNMTQLAASTEQSRQNLTNKMTRDNFTEKDIIKIADALGCKVDVVFTLPDGTQI